MNSTLPSRAALCLLMAAACAFANEGTKARAAAADYSVHAQTPDGVEIGAEYNVRTVAADARSVVLPDHLSVEVAIYPPRGLSGVGVAARQFSLRVNGSRELVFADTPGAVAASVKYSDWSRERAAVVIAGPVIIGAPQPAPRFPGDQRPPHPPPPAGTVTTVEDSPWITEVALREGRATGPVSGYVYFPYKGKVRKLRSVELLYRLHSDSEPVVMRLR